MAKLGPYPPYGWSHSRQYQADVCWRRYYHHTYGSWHGWDAKQSDPAWLTYRLKKLVSPGQFAGTLIHQVVREQVIPAIREGRELPDVEKVIETCQAELERVRRRTWVEHIRAPKLGMLRERHFQLLEDLVEICQEAEDTIDLCLNRLWEHPLIEELRAVGPSRILVADAFDSALLTYRDGYQVPLSAAPDLAYTTLDEPPLLMLVDWKTGSLKGVEAQLATYAVYVRSKWNIPFAPGRYRGLAVDLQDPARSRSIEITREMMVDAATRIREGEEAMRHFVADPALNKPVAKQQFPMIPEDSEERGQCRWCVYAEICSEDRYPGINGRQEKACETDGGEAAGGHNG